MKIVILSRNPDIYSTRRLVETAQHRGHEVQVLDTLRCYMNISAENLNIYYQKTQLAHFDAVIPRIGASITNYGTAVVRQFERMKIYSLNTAAAIALARDKLRSFQVLAQAGFILPKTGFADSAEDVAHLISLVAGPPLVIKLLEGTQGIGVILAETQQAATSAIEAFNGLRINILVQEFIKEAEGADIRCFVVGGRVVASIKRQARVGEFRSNLHRGGVATPIKITPQERAVAIKAVKCLKLEVAGVDIIRSHRGPMVIEVNASPGLEGIENATGKDIANDIINYVEKRVLHINKK